VSDELAACLISLLMVVAMIGGTVIQDSGGELPECDALTAKVEQKVFPIPDSNNLHGIVVIVDDEVNDTFDGRYYIIVSNDTYGDYEVNDTFAEFICSAEEYEKIKEFLYFLLTLDYIFQS
jgi:hypothetical protein